MPLLSALASAVPGRDTPPLVTDLDLVGVSVLASVDCTAIVQETIRTAPDLVICYDPSPGDALFATLATLSTTAPRPVVLFTDDPDAGRIEQAMRSGVSAYVVGGYGALRLRSVIHAAMARFARDQALAGELAELQRRFAERTLVDRAKGILMGARQLREAEAYRALRAAAMQTKQRIGQVSRMVIDQAHYAEAINRAGQFRMLSQRLVKLHALACAKVALPQTLAMIEASVGQTDANLAALEKSLSRATFGDLLDAVAAPWSRLKPALVAAPDPAGLDNVNRLADALLLRAERLTNNLEIAGLAAALHVINVSGRQRMLSQRLAKEALLATMLPGEAGLRFATAMAGTRAEFRDGLAYLGAVPLTNVPIQGELASAASAFGPFEAALDRAYTHAGRERIAELSEVLLATFDRLTNHYENGVQALS